MKKTALITVGFLTGVGFAVLFFAFYPKTNHGISAYHEIPGTDVTVWISRQEPITFFHEYDRTLQVGVDDDFVFMLPLQAQRWEDTTINLYMASSNTFVLRDRLHTYSVFVDDTDVSCLVGEATHTNIGWEYCGTFSDGPRGWRFYSPDKLPEPTLTPADKDLTPAIMKQELPPIRDRDALIEDSTRIIRTVTNAVVPKEDWPASILLLTPSHVATYRDYLFITVYETNEMAKGYMISPIVPGTSPALDGVFILRLKDPIVMRFHKRR